MSKEFQSNLLDEVNMFRGKGDVNEIDHYVNHDD